MAGGTESLVDLLVRGNAGPSRNAAPHLELRELAGSSVSTVAALAAAEGWLADSPWVGAWLIAEQLWCGAQRAEWIEPSGVEVAGGIGRSICATGSIREFLARVDAARRAGGAGAGVNERALRWQSAAERGGQTATDAAEAPLAAGLRSEPTPALWVQVSTAYTPESVRALLDGVCALMEACLVDIDRSVGELESVPDAESRQRLNDWGTSVATGSASATICERFASQVSAHADVDALTWRNGRLTYRELDSWSNRVCRLLQSSDVRSGDLVCVALPRSPTAIAVLLGVLKAGAAYLPLDSGQPAERRRQMLDDAGVSLVLTTTDHRGDFGPGLPTLAIDDVQFAGTELASIAPVDIDGESLAYVMYTSGSTGVPKGIEIPHRSILRLVVDVAYARLQPGVTVLHAAPLGFDASTFEVWGPLLNGGTCVLHDEELPTPTGLARTIRSQGVTTAWLTAALFNAVVDDDPQYLYGLTQLLIGGEALSVTHVQRAMQALPQLTLINGYGPTECTTFTTTYPIPTELPVGSWSIPIGRPIAATTVSVLGPTGQRVPAGLVGELVVGGLGVARGYRHRPDLTAERFLDDPEGPPGARRYRTGDLVRWLPDGNLDFVGRRDGQVKVRGFRIELAEIEFALAGHPAVQHCAVIAGLDAVGTTRLVAYLVPAGDACPWAEVRAFLAERLPDFMVPPVAVWLPALPMTINGKLDRRALPPAPSHRPDLVVAYQQPVGDLERRVCDVFAEVLGLDCVGRADNFFELGGNSLLVLRALARLAAGGGPEVSTNAFFRLPTAQGLAAEIGGRGVAPGARRMSRHVHDRSGSAREPIAIIAMAGRFPGAADVDAFWANLCEGRDTVTRFADDALDPSLPADLTGDPCYVKARGIVDGAELFDAAFFGISPREADLMDPQQRLFLEVCWECLERGGYPPDAGAMPIGVFAGMNNATYFQRHVQHHPELIERIGEFQVMLANEKDYIATRAAHKLNLTGPAISVHTACSTSLVAIAQALAALRAGQCDMALAGGSSITCPPNSGYLYQEGAMLSPDGRTRSFDVDAQGTVFSDGVATVLLKRLSDALADGDTVHAVIRGAAVNNDGRDKASFTAPSVDGQSAVIAAALADADVDARSISYVETHGTATPLGDPVEVEALTRTYRRDTDDVGFCRIGSVKSNVGHLVMAAGATGVIKTALALASERLPASIHFKSPNPKIAFAASPFVVNDRLTPWPRGDRPRRAAVSSFGVGGTNAHAILEEAPVSTPSTTAVGPQLLMLSARSPAALSAMALRLADRLEADPATNLADVAHTLQQGRSRFAHRLCVVGDHVERAVTALRSADDPARAMRRVGASTPKTVWMFPGQGAQYAGMGRGLYESDPVFRNAFDLCCGALEGVLPFDLKSRMFGDEADALVATATTQPAMFCLEYALAQSWLARGLEPALLIGHSVGEFVAATLAGVMTPVDAVRLVGRRGALMQALPPGSMLTVRLSAEDVLARLPQGLSMAAHNGPSTCVVAGPRAAVEAWQSELEAGGVVARLLQTSHAFHSSMMDPAVAPFEADMRQVRLSPPRRAIVSTLTGEPLTDEQATDPGYWARHLREPVRFFPAVRAARSALPDAVFLEVGPRGTLATLARQHRDGQGAAVVAVVSLADAPQVEVSSLMLAVGQLWTAGWEPPLPVAVPSTGRRRVLLPTYPFERQRHWIEAARRMRTAAGSTATAAAAPSEHRDRESTPNIPPTAIPTAMPSVSRLPRLIEQLRQVFEDVAGTELGGVDPATGFVDLGLDSLTLTQAALQVKKQFGVPVTFRQLMESHRSLASLGEYLDSSLPPDAAPAPAVAVPPAATTPSAAVTPTPTAFVVAVPSTPVDQPLLQQVIQQQMQLMAQQLALLGGAAPGTVVGEPLTGTSTQPAPAAPVVAATLPTGGAAAAAATDDGGTVRYDVKKAFGAIARIHTQGNELTERQQARLQAFVRRYVERTRRSKEYTTFHRPRLADPRVVNGFRPMTKEIAYQIVVERSKGARLWDIDGNEYVDVLNGFGMNLFGWQPEFVQEAVRRQLDLGYEIGPQHPLAGEVAALVCELTGFDRAGLCNTGSEAVMAAVRIARTVTGRSTVVVFTGSYHGTFDEVVVRAGRGGKGIPAAPGIMRGMFGDVRVLDYGTAESLAFIRANSEDLAAVLVEPIQSRRPDFQPKDFLKEVRAITQGSGTCLIFDEVITGFRSQIGGAQAYYGIRADLASYGKVIGGGFPVGVIAGKREYMDALDGGQWSFGDDSMPTVGVTYFAGTFVRHPLALAAAKASLQHLKERGPALQTELNVHTASMADELTAFCRQVGAPIEIRYFASLWRVSWREDHPMQDLLFAMMRSRGVHILDNFPCFLTTAHTPQDIATIKSAFKESVLELQEAEFLPRRADDNAEAVDQSRTPMPNAKLGRDKDGRPTWFVPDPDAPGKYKKINA